MEESNDVTKNLSEEELLEWAILLMEVVRGKDRYEILKEIEEREANQEQNKTA